MYAILKNGGKQYKVEQGSIILLDKLSLEPKSKISFEEVLALHDGKSIVVARPLLKERR